MTRSPQAEFVPEYGQKLSARVGTWSAGHTRAIAAKDSELGFLAAFLWRLAEWAGFEEREGMRLPGSCKNDWKFQPNNKRYEVTTPGLGRNNLCVCAAGTELRLSGMHSHVRAFLQVISRVQ